jgi:hypothetical protein
MITNLEAHLMRVREALGARLGGPVQHHGVLATTRPLAMSAANLAALEAAWRFEAEGADATASRR